MRAIFSHGTQVLGWKAIYPDYLRWLRQAEAGVTSLTKQQSVLIGSSGPRHSLTVVYYRDATGEDKLPAFPNESRL